MLPTQTILQTQVFPQIYSVTWHAVSVTKKVSEFLEEMKNSPLFSDSMALLLEWEEQFASSNFEEAKERDENAKILCHFLSDVIRPALCMEPNLKNKKQILKFEVMLREILQHILPDKAAINAYIENSEKFSGERQKIEELQKRLNSSFETQKAALMERANAVNIAICNQASIQQNAYRTLNSERQGQADEANASIDVLTNHVNQISQVVEDHLIRAEEVGNKVQAQRDEIKNISDMCITIFNKV